jgi:hypothetical protein
MSGIQNTYEGPFRLSLKPPSNNTPFVVEMSMLESAAIMNTGSFRESLTSAIRYWEPRRLIYNGVLAAIVLIYFGRNYPATKSLVSIDSVLLLFILVVLANVVYCAAYVVDVFVSASSLREQWQTRRWIIFLIGLLFAAVITRFFAIGMFQSH